MKDNFFADSNIVVYVFDNDVSKKSTAIKLIKGSPFISPQVVIESLNVSIKKLKISKEQAFQNALFLIQYCKFYPINTSTFLMSFNISRKYNFSHLDSLIISSALESECKILYSEDIQHNQKIENKLLIINPFL